MPEVGAYRVPKLKFWVDFRLAFISRTTTVTTSPFHSGKQGVKLLLRPKVRLVT